MWNSKGRTDQISAKSNVHRNNRRVVREQKQFNLPHSKQKSTTLLEFQFIVSVYNSHTAVKWKPVFIEKEIHFNVALHLFICFGLLLVFGYFLWKPTKCPKVRCSFKILLFVSIYYLKITTRVCIIYNAHNKEQLTL